MLLEVDVSICRSYALVEGHWGRLKASEIGTKSTGETAVTRKRETRTACQCRLSYIHPLGELGVGSSLPLSRLHPCGNMRPSDTAPYSRIWPASAPLQTCLHPHRRPSIPHQRATSQSQHPKKTYIRYGEMCAIVRVKPSGQGCRKLRCQDLLLDEHGAASSINRVASSMPCADEVGNDKRHPLPLSRPSEPALMWCLLMLPCRPQRLKGSWLHISTSRLPPRQASGATTRNRRHGVIREWTPHACRGGQ